MQDDAGLEEAGADYAVAYAAQYRRKDLNEALGLYRDLLTAHPETPEAEYARAQIQNIVRSVVPRQDLLDAHLGLALAHLADAGPA